jgi:glutamine---fructose-6-phosphate transaminase (isomerizing)
MDARKEIREIPRALKQTFEKGRPEFEALVRQTRWGTGPLYLVGNGPQYFSALTGVRAFEELLGWPVIARRAGEFAAYSESLMRPRTVLLAVSADGASSETVDASREARSRGAALLALTAVPTSPLAEMADGVFLVRGAEETLTGLAAHFCVQAAMGFISLVAACVLKRHHQKLDDLEQEFKKLPEDAEWILTRYTDALSLCAEELEGHSALTVVGSGHYYPAALQAAWALRNLTSLDAAALEVEEFHAQTSPRQAHNPVLFLSGSRCRMKKRIRDAAQKAKAGERKVFAVTDANDQDLAGLSSPAVLLPARSELTGSTLGLLFLLALVGQISMGDRAGGGKSARRNT